MAVGDIRGVSIEFAQKNETKSMQEHQRKQGRRRKSKNKKKDVGKDMPVINRKHNQQHLTQIRHDMGEGGALGEAYADELQGELWSPVMSPMVMWARLLGESNFVGSDLNLFICGAEAGQPQNEVWVSIKPSSARSHGLCRQEMSSSLQINIIFPMIQSLPEAVLTTQLGDIWRFAALFSSAPEPGPNRTVDRLLLSLEASYRCCKSSQVSLASDKVTDDRRQQNDLVADSGNREGNERQWENWDCPKDNANFTSGGNMNNPLFCGCQFI
ncbi:hypothetical protein C8J56DRAFT_900791 [Mycena floridula]|nr:hypothetical protein C8J56DRAFT_900791 [Mycena floridula]